MKEDYRWPLMDHGDSKSQPTADRGLGLLSGGNGIRAGALLCLQLEGGRVIPNCFIRLRKVPGGIPRRIAAPSGPSIRQFVSVRV